MGMPFAEAEALLRGIPGYRPPEPGTRFNLGFAHYESELSLSVGRDRQGQVKAVEVYRPEREVSVFFRDIAVFDLPAEEVVSRLQAVTRIEVQDGGRTILAPDLLLCLWRPSLPDDPEDYDGQFFETVLVAAPGYYEETEPRISEVPAETARVREISGQEGLF
jgi:hypothetical protein